MKPGKPAQHMGPGGQQVRAYLDMETIDKARQLGDGNFSLGVRYAVKTIFDTKNKINVDVNRIVYDTDHTVTDSHEAALGYQGGNRAWQYSP